MLEDFERLDALSRLVKTCEGWRWLAGMHALTDATGTLQAAGRVTDPAKVGPDLIPDLTDPATLGAVAYLARHKWQGLGHFDTLQANFFCALGGSIDDLEDLVTAWAS